MVGVAEARSDTLIVTLSSFEAAFVGVAIEREVARTRQDGLRAPRLSELAELGERLRRFAAPVPSTERVVDVPGSEPSSSGLTTTVVAARLRCGERNVRKLLGVGLLRGRQVGRVWLVDPGSVEDYVTTRGIA